MKDIEQALNKVATRIRIGRQGGVPLTQLQLGDCTYSARESFWSTFSAAIAAMQTQNTVDTVALPATEYIQRIISLLAIPVNSQSTLFELIAKSNDTELTLRCIALLSCIQVTGSRTTEWPATRACLMVLLQYQNDKEMGSHTFGHCLVYKGNVEIIESYLNFLHNLGCERGVNLDDLVDLLKLQDVNGGTFGRESLFLGDGGKIARRYLTLIKDLSRRVDPAKMGELLNSNGRGTSTFGLAIAESRVVETIQQYLLLLHDLYLPPMGAHRQDIASQASEHKSTGVPPTYVMGDDEVKAIQSACCHDGETLYLLFWLLSDEQCKIMAGHRKAIMGYICSDQCSIRNLEALQHALSPTHPIGRLFQGQEADLMFIKERLDNPLTEQALDNLYRIQIERECTAGLTTSQVTSEDSKYGPIYQAILNLGEDKIKDAQIIMRLLAPSRPTVVYNKEWFLVDLSRLYADSSAPATVTQFLHTLCGLKIVTPAQILDLLKMRNARGRNFVEAMGASMACLDYYFIFLDELRKQDTFSPVEIINLLKDWLTSNNLHQFSLSQPYLCLLENLRQELRVEAADIVALLRMPIDSRHVEFGERSQQYLTLLDKFRQQPGVNPADIAKLLQSSHNYYNYGEFGCYCIGEGYSRNAKQCFLLVTQYLLLLRNLYQQPPEMVEEEFQALLGGLIERSVLQRKAMGLLSMPGDLETYAKIMILRTHWQKPNGQAIVRMLDLIGGTVHKGYNLLEMAAGVGDGKAALQCIKFLDRLYEEKHVVPAKIIELFRLNEPTFGDQLFRWKNEMIALTYLSLLDKVGQLAVAEVRLLFKSWASLEYANRMKLSAEDRSFSFPQLLVTCQQERVILKFFEFLAKFPTQPQEEGEGLRTMTDAEVAAIISKRSNSGYMLYLLCKVYSLTDRQYAMVAPYKGEVASYLFGLNNQEALTDALLRRDPVGRLMWTPHGYGMNPSRGRGTLGRIERALQNLQSRPAETSGIAATSVSTSASTSTSTTTTASVGQFGGFASLWPALRLAQSDTDQPKERRDELVPLRKKSDGETSSPGAGLGSTGS